MNRNSISPRWRRKIGWTCWTMLMLAGSLLGLTVFLYVRTWDALSAWATSTIPPNEAAQLVTATKAAWFGVIPALAVVFVGCSLTILHGAAAAARDQAALTAGHEPTTDQA